MYKQLLENFIDTDSTEVELKTDSESTILLKRDRGIISDIFTVRVNKAVFKKASKIEETLAELPRMPALELIAIRSDRPSWSGSDFVTMVYTRKHA